MLNCELDGFGAARTYSILNYDEIAACHLETIFSNVGAPGDKFV